MFEPSFFSHLFFPDRPYFRCQDHDPDDKCDYFAQADDDGEKKKKKKEKEKKKNLKSYEGEKRCE